MANYYFYVLLCSDNSFYGGYTTNLDRRVAAHNAGKGAKYTKSRRPVRLLYSESFEDKSQALQREYWFKKILKYRKKKEDFLREQGVTLNN